VIAWQRRANGRTLTVVANLSGERITGLTLPDGLESAFRRELLSGASLDGASPLALEPHDLLVFAPAD